MIEAVSAQSWRVGGVASRLMPPTIIAWDSFQARARPLPRLPRRARGSLKRPPKTSPNGGNNDLSRLRCRRRPSDQPQNRHLLKRTVEHAEADKRFARAGVA